MISYASIEVGRDGFEMIVALFPWLEESIAVAPDVSSKV
jgi:hypothetical protein